MNQPGGSAGSDSRRRGFATTHWSLVVAAAEGAPADSRNALAALCRTYWYPLYAYLRSHCHGQHDAEDLTQEFFATLLEKGHLQAADRRRGRFRSFLLTVFKRFLAKEQERAERASVAVEEPSSRSTSHRARNAISVSRPTTGRRSASSTGAGL